jgi:hypothetical protein
VLVILTASNGMRPWAITTPDPAILAPAANPPAGAGQTALGYRAAAPGTAEIMATDRPACAPGQACPQFIVAFRATVVVDTG